MTHQKFPITTEPTTNDDDSTEKKNRKLAIIKEKTLDFKHTDGLGMTKQKR